VKLYVKAPLVANAHQRPNRIFSWSQNIIKAISKEKVDWKKEDVVVVRNDRRTGRKKLK
jgi:hypothetical protein